MVKRSTRHRRLPRGDCTAGLKARSTASARSDSNAMSKLKPLKKIVGKAKELRERHRERYRPTGFGFALADSVDYLDAARWDALTGSTSVFLSRPYLQVLETAGPK